MSEDDANRISFLEALQFDCNLIYHECEDMIKAKSRKRDDERLASIEVYFARMQDTFKAAVKK